MSASPGGDPARLRLARLALDAAGRVSGVVGTDPGPSGLCVTADPPYGVLRGVSVIAQADGRYEVDLCLNAQLVPLLALGEAVSTAVRRRTEREGVEFLLGEVNIEFARVLTDAEIVAEGQRAAHLAAEEAGAAADVVVVTVRAPAPGPA